MSSIQFSVGGQPATKGSTVSFLTEAGKVQTRTDSARLRTWSRAVAWTAKSAGVRCLPRGVAVRLDVRFQFEEPKRHTRVSPTVRPDIDKTLRALLDSLTGIAFECREREEDVLHVPLPSLLIPRRGASHNGAPLASELLHRTRSSS